MFYFAATTWQTKGIESRNALVLAEHEASENYKEIAENSIDDGKWHKVKVTVSKGKNITAYYDGEKKLSLVVDNLPKTAYIGIQAWSGIYAGYHDLRNVKISNSQLKLSDKEVKLNKGEPFYLDYSYTGTSTAKAKFTSSKSSVAKVSSTGKVVPVSAGAANITCKVGNSEATCKVIVLPKKIAGVKKVSASRNTIKLSWTKQTGVSGYEVWMYDKDLEEYAKVKNVDKSFNSANITGLKKGTSYKFYVRSYVKVGNKKYYSEKSKIYTAKTTK